MKKFLLFSAALTFGLTINAQVLYDQTASVGTNGIISNYMTDKDTLVKSADNFVVPVGGTFEVTSVSVRGFRNAAGATMDSMAVEIYSNTGTAPGALIYSDVHMMGVGGVPGPVLDTTITITIPMQTLTAGTYWLCVYGFAPSTSRWNWYTTTGAAINGDANLIDEDDFFGAGATNWTTFTTLGLTEKNVAFTINGTDYMAGVGESSQTLSIYPSPVNENLFIKTSANAVEQITIYSISGELMYTEFTNAKIVDVSFLASGVYVVHVQTEAGTLTEKFVKE